MWLQKLKIAIVEEDIDIINTLLEDVPLLREDKEIDEAQTLLHEALVLVVKLQNNTKNLMIKIKKNIDFLNAIEGTSFNKLDIVS